MLEKRAEIINNIIQQRRPIVDKVSATQAKLSHVVEEFEAFNRLCSSLMQDTEISSEFLPLTGILNEAEKSLDKARTLRDDLARLQKRFSRNTLNIAVIGRARQGKSRLLQTITGLGAEEIPDGNQAFCTGVRSDIINNPSVKDAYAQVNFLTEKRFINENIAPYFKDLQEYKSDLFTPLTIEEFRSFPLPEPGSFQASPEATTQMNLHLQHLKDLQDHLHQYSEYLGHAPIQISKDQIREYVAQDNKDGERVFFKHMAVDNVEIFCKFPNDDVGALRLIDLPGLGDTRKGDVERVIGALSDQVDMVFFLSKPNNAGAGWQDNEVHLYSQARRALGEKLPIEHWSFWVFNQDSRPGANNEKQCLSLSRSIKEAQINVAETVIVDCTNKRAVSSDLIDVAMNFLTKNIERNDREYAENVQKAVSDMIDDLNKTISRALELVKDDTNVESDMSDFDDLFEDLFAQLQFELQESVGIDSKLRLNRNNPCEQLQNLIETILDEEENNEFTNDDVKRIMTIGGGSPFNDGLHELRTRLSEKLQQNLDQELDEVLNNVKDQISGILASTGRLEKHFGVSDRSLLGKIIEFIKTSGYEKKLPNILRGLELLDGWRMDYRSFIQHRMRDALNNLDPLAEDSQMFGQPKSAKIEDFTMLFNALYRETIEKLRGNFEDIYPEPNKASFAIAEEFKDIMIRAKGFGGISLRNQWRALYRPIRGDIWPEEYGATQIKRNVATRLRGPLEVLSSDCLVQNFMFLQ